MQTTDSQVQAMASIEGPTAQLLEAQPGLPEAMPRPSSDEAKCFFDFTLPQLSEYLKGLGKESYRAKQLYQWVYQSRTEDFEAMTNVSKAFREELPERLKFNRPKAVQSLISRDGTRKWLFDVGDGLTVETVLIPSKDRFTLCVSSEVGCNMACRFCYTGKQKLKRRLRTSEIVGQFVHAQDELAKEGLRVTNIVFMGMGEPLDNCQAVFDSIEILHSQEGYGLSKKRITVSTSGIVPEMHRIGAAGVRLAVSLNASNDEIRNRVMPINRRWPLKDLLQACRDYYQATRDRITFEYVLLKGVTDQLEHAREVVDLLRGIPCKINIIPFNEHPGTEFLRPEDQQVVRFQEELIRLGAHVLLRRTMGRDIFAACGQLTSLYDGRPERMPNVEPFKVPKLNIDFQTKELQ